MAKKTKVIGAKIEVDTSGASKSVGELGKELGSLSPAAKKASEAANLFNNALNIIRANPIIAVVTTLVGVVTALFQPFKKMEGVSDALGKSFGILSGIFTTFITKVLTPLIDGFIQFTEVINEGVIVALDALGISSKATSERFGEITEALDDLEDAQRNSALATAESNRRLQEAREIAADANRPIKERVTALKEAARIEKEETDKVIAINKQRAKLLLEQLALELGARENVLKVIRSGTLENLKIARAELMGMKNIDKDKLAAIDALIIAAEDAAAQSAKIAKRTQGQIASIEKEGQAKIKEQQDKAFEDKLKLMEANDKLDDAKLKKLKADALAIAKDEQQKLEVEKVFAEKSYQQTKKDLEDKQKLYKKDSIEYKNLQTEIINLDAENVAKKIELSEKQTAIDKKNKDDQQKALEDRLKAQQEWDAFYYKQMEEIKKLDQDRQDAAFAANIAIGQSWVDLGKNISTTIGNLTGVFDEGSDLAKAFGVAQVAIATAASIGSILLSGRQQQAEYNKAIAAGNATIGVGIASAFIPGMQGLAAAQIASGKAAVGAAMIGKGVSKANTIAQAVGAGVAGAAQIAAILSAGKSKAAPSTGAGGSDTGGGSVVASAPLTPAVSTTTLNQSQVNQMGNQAQRAYVVESDVSGNQERITRLNRAARIN
jgi:dUTPase